MPTTQDVLTSVPLFAKLPQKTLDRLSRIVVEREFPTGTNIVSEGEVGAGFFLIEDGNVDVVRGQPETKITALGKGDYFGDMALLDGRPRVATVRATSDTKCLVMTRWDFLAELRGSPDIAIELLEELSLRVRDLEARLTA